MSEESDALLHIADDHPCCKTTLIWAHNRLLGLERENTALREAAPKIKAAVSEQLQAALSGLDLSLRYTDNPNRPNQFIRWGLVEKRIYEAVDAALAGKEAQP